MEKRAFWNIRLIVALTGFFFLVLAMTLFIVFPVFFEPLAVSKSRIGMIMGIHSLMAILVRPWFGRLIDLRGRKIISLLGIATLMLVIPGFHFIRDGGLFPLFLRAITGIGWGMAVTAVITICVDLAPSRRVAKSMGIVGASSLAVAAIGPMLGEEIVNRWGFGALFNTSLIFLAVAFACMLATKEVVTHKTNDVQPSGKANLKLLLLSMIPLVVLIVMHGAVRGAVVNFIVLFSLSVPLDRAGPFFLSYSAVALLTRLLFADLSDRFGRKKVILPAVVIVSLNLLVISQIRSLGMLVLSGLIAGFGQGLIFPAISAYVIDIIGQERKGLAIGIYLTLFDCGMGLGSAFFGWLSDLGGYRMMYILAAVFFMAAGLFFSWKASPGENPQDA